MPYINGQEFMPETRYTPVSLVKSKDTAQKNSLHSDDQAPTLLEQHIKAISDASFKGIRTASPTQSMTHSSDGSGRASPIVIVDKTDSSKTTNLFQRIYEAWSRFVCGLRDIWDRCFPASNRDVDIRAILKDVLADTENAITPSCPTGLETEDVAETHRTNNGNNLVSHLFFLSSLPIDPMYLDTLKKHPEMLNTIRKLEAQVLGLVGQDTYTKLQEKVKEMTTAAKPNIYNQDHATK